MSTHPRHEPSTDPTPMEPTPTMTPTDETPAAPLMFSTDNERPIQGFFDAESDEHGA